MQLKVNNLKKELKFQQKIINLNFELEAGDCLAILGENSAGKTTYLRLLAGFLTADSGDITLFTKNYTAKNIQLQKLLGYLPEDFGFNSNLTLEYYLRFIATIKGLKKQKTLWRLEQIIADFDLKTKLKTKIGNLSKGFKQRLGLASVLINNPQLLILDEATQGLDFSQKKQLYQLLSKNSDERICIISTHYLEEALLLANKIMLIKDFEIYFFDTKDELLKKSLNFYNAKETNNLQSLDNISLVEFFLANFTNSKFDDLQSDKPKNLRDI